MPVIGGCGGEAIAMIWGGTCNKRNRYAAHSTRHSCESGNPASFLTLKRGYCASHRNLPLHLLKEPFDPVEQCAPFQRSDGKAAADHRPSVRHRSAHAGTAAEGRVVSVGRLDFNTEGLLLLTTDGEIARRMEIPSSGWTRVYRVRLFGKVTQADLDKLATGITIAGVKYGPIVADIERSKGMHSWATVSLKEGKNREIKRVMEGLGLKVSRLIRTAYGPFQLGQLPEGPIEEIPAKLWRDKLGIGRKKRADRDE
jgi:23S rRNA pseudouridine2605 synthase